MSYILNALKKSENKNPERDIKIRKQVLVMKRQTTGKNIKVFSILAILLGTLIVGWLLGHHQLSQPDNTADSITPGRSLDEKHLFHKNTEQFIKKEKSEEYAKDTEKLVAKNSFSNSVENKKIQRSEHNTSELNPPIPVRAAPDLIKKQPKKVPPTDLEPAEIEMETSSIQNYSELSFSTKQKLPELETSLHFYNSSPARRIARINGKILHENDSILTGLTVQEIRPATTVLNYNGLFFELNAPGG